ncbi:MAG: hypothetical protein KW802_00805 [Candidatus Doudnabacteria bacterium]|nr:hypothetical protein [Candidatus Doudnabacteria bacterium]
MDIVKKLTFAHLKASLQTLKPRQKFFLQVFIFAILLNILPLQAQALTIKAPTARKPILVFDTSDKSFQDMIDAFNQTLHGRNIDEKVRQENFRRAKLIRKVKTYLDAQKSPLANEADVLVTVKNWKKIVALSNAESSMCRRYPVPTANCWGVGGSKLWDFGSNLSDGILGMNKFLNQYPLRSSVKYSEMSFKQMNGLYKQPAAAHWLYNTQSVYDDLTQLEKSI